MRERDRPHVTVLVLVSSEVGNGRPESVSKVKLGGSSTLTSVRGGVGRLKR